MHSQNPLPKSLQLSLPLGQRLTLATRNMEAAVQSASPSPASRSGSEVDNDGQVSEIIAKLKRWRSKVSSALGIPAYRVLTNATIDRIAEACPGTSEELESVSGVGPATISQFGDDIIKLIESFRSETVSPSIKNRAGSRYTAIVILWAECHQTDRYPNKSSPSIHFNQHFRHQNRKLYRRFPRSRTRIGCQRWTMEARAKCPAIGLGGCFRTGIQSQR